MNKIKGFKGKSILLRCRPGQVNFPLKLTITPCSYNVKEEKYLHCTHKIFRTLELNSYINVSYNSCCINTVLITSRGPINQFKLVW